MGLYNIFFPISFPPLDTKEGLYRALVEFITAEASGI